MSTGLSLNGGAGLYSTDDRVKEERCQGAENASTEHELDEAPCFELR